HTVCDGLCIIVRPPRELGAAAYVTNAAHLRSLETVVIALTAFGARISADNAFDEAIVIDLELDHGIQPLALAIEHPVEGGCLLQRARKAVKNEAGLAVRLLDTLGDDADDNVVGNELALLHERL